MRHAGASGDRRVAQHDWCVREVVEESHTRAQQDCRDVDVNLVEQAGIQHTVGDEVHRAASHGFMGGRRVRNIRNAELSS